MLLNCVLLKNCYISARELWSVSGGGFGGVSVGRSGWRSVGGSELREGLGVGESGTL